MQSLRFFRVHFQIIFIKISGSWRSTVDMLCELAISNPSGYAGWCGGSIRLSGVIPDESVPGNTFQLRYKIPPASSGSTVDSLTIWNCPGNLHTEAKTLPSNTYTTFAGFFLVKSAATQQSKLTSTTCIGIIILVDIMKCSLL